MTQDEKWMKNYQEVMEYMESNKRNPSKYDITVRSLYTWIKHQRKVMNAGKLQGERLDLLRMLLPSSYQVVAKLLLSIPSIRELLDKMVIPKSAKEMCEFCGQKEAGLDSEMGAGPIFFKKNAVIL